MHKTIVRIKKNDFFSVMELRALFLNRAQFHYGKKIVKITLPETFALDDHHIFQNDPFLSELNTVVQKNCIAIDLESNGSAWIYRPPFIVDHVLAAPRSLIERWLRRDYPVNPIRMYKENRCM